MNSNKAHWPRANQICVSLGTSTLFGGYVRVDTNAAGGEETLPLKVDRIVMIIVIIFSKRFERTIESSLARIGSRKSGKIELESRNSLIRSSSLSRGAKIATTEQRLGDFWQ